jgi:uncharacterized damage-inducible protein DinB
MYNFKWMDNMTDSILSKLIDDFARLVVSLPDTELERPWAWGAYDSEGLRFAFFRIFEELRELSVKIAYQRFASGVGITSAQRILANYHQAYKDLCILLLGLSTQELEREPEAGEWSIKRTYAHIVGAEAGFLVITKYALERARINDNRPEVVPDAAWDAILRLEEPEFIAILEGTFDTLYSYHASLNDRVLNELSDITEEELSTPSQYWEGYDLDLRFRLHRFESHLRQHIIQIEKILASQGQPWNEARRLLRMIYAALAQVEGARLGYEDSSEALVATTAQEIKSITSEIADILG